MPGPLVTDLGLTGTPADPESFSAKAPAGAGPHTGLFTDLAVSATPGGLFGFSPKNPAGAGPHVGDFTDLAVMCLPGGLFSFTPKTPAVPPSTQSPPYYPPFMDFGFRPGISVLSDVYDERLSTTGHTYMGNVPIRRRPLWFRDPHIPQHDEMMTHAQAPVTPRPAPRSLLDMRLARLLPQRGAVPSLVVR